MHDGLASDSHVIALFLELLWSSSEHWERVEVHWDDKMWSWQEVLDGVSSLSWTHTEAVADWEASDVGLVELIDQFHVGENIGVTSAVDPQVVIWDIDDETTSLSTSYLHSLWSNASRWVISGDHGHLGEAEVLGSSLLHLGHESWWNFPEELIISSDLGAANNFSFFAFSCHD